MTQLALFSALLLPVLGCGKAAQDRKVEFGGYAKNIQTNEVMKNFKVSVELPSKNMDVDVDKDSGKFEFSVPAGSDYQVVVTADGYREFRSINRAPYEAQVRLADNDGEIDQKFAYLYHVPMVPSALKSPEVKLSVEDKETGAKIESGTYRLVAKSVGAIYSPVYSAGNYDQNLQSRWWLPTVSPVTGTLTKGAGKVEAGALVPGVVYQVVAFGGDSYREGTADLDLSTIDVQRGVRLGLTRFDRSAGPALLARSDWRDAAGTLPLPESRELVLTFDRPIQLSTRSLQGVAAGQLLEVVTADTNRDNKRTSTTIRPETLATNALSQMIKFTASEKTLTIQFPADTALITGEIDSADELAYRLTTQLLNGIEVRAVEGNPNWFPLARLVPNEFTLTQVVIRGR